MLIDFRVENFRSFEKEQTLSLVASNKFLDHAEHCVPIGETGKKALRTCVLYGANASGKSNLVKAIQFAKKLILIRGSGLLNALISNQFRFGKKKALSTFEFRFLASGRVYTYGFSVTASSVEDEWLSVIAPSGREDDIFTRSKQKISIGTSRTLFAGKMEVSKQALQALRVLKPKPDQLLLNRLIDVDFESQGELLRPVTWWFFACLIVIEPQATFGPLVDLLESEEHFRKFAGEFLSGVGTGIEELVVETKKVEMDKLPRELLKALQETKAGESSVSIGHPSVDFQLDPDDPSTVVRRNLIAQHRVSGSQFTIPFQEESDGTQRCLDLLPALFHFKMKERVFVVDEINRSLHPLLCYALLEFFLTGNVEATHQQLIVTTHETHLLDQELLRRDEIWFVEKDSNQSTQLHSLSDMNVRNDVRIEKGYLHGRFGGIPIIEHGGKLRDMIRTSSNGRTNGKKKTAHR